MPGHPWPALEAPLPYNLIVGVNVVQGLLARSGQAPAVDARMVADHLGAAVRRVAAAPMHDDVVVGRVNCRAPNAVRVGPARGHYAHPGVGRQVLESIRGRNEVRSRPLIEEGRDKRSL